MADTKISGLGAYLGASVTTSTDVLPIVCTSTTTTKKILASELLIAIGGVQSGSIIDYGGTSAPSGWLNCDGSAVSRTTYAALFAAISTNFGAGDTSTTFNVPDFRRRTSIGSGGVSTATIGASVGNTGGEENHTLLTAELPALNFATNPDLFGQTGGAGPDRNVNGTGVSGSGTAHNTMQPSIVVYKIIKT